MSDKDFRQAADDLLTERRSKLSSGKLALLEKLKGGGQVTVRRNDIPRRSGDGVIPLSFAQQRLWFLDQLIPDSPAYNVVMAFRLSGRPQVGILEASINEVIRRHEALRTTFQNVDGQPFQAVAPELQLSLPTIDLTGLPASEREARFQQMAQEESRHVFNLSDGPLLRVTLFRLEEERHILLMNVHHIVIDGWSMGVFFREINALYHAFSAGRPSPLPELPIQYADYSTWERQWMQGEVLEKQLSYWRDTLGTEQKVLELPHDRTRRPVQTFHGGSFRLRVPSELASAIKQLSERANASLFMVLITALKIVLHRYSGQEEIRVGTPVANRNRVETEELIGFFVNTLVLNTDLSGNPSFVEMLGRLRDAANSAYLHQDLPFEVLVDELQPERNTSQNPLFEVCFVLQNFPMPKRAEAAELDFVLEGIDEIRNDTAKFDIWIQAVEKDGGLDLDVEFNSDIFNQSTVERILESYCILLEGIAEDPQQHISELSILSAAEKRKLLVEWNDTAVTYPQQEQSLHVLIEEQARRTPHAPAVMFADEQLSYAELNERANRLAHHLAAKGVGPETMVGIFMERSFEMIVGLIGILKAGAAYIPLDPSYPPDRVAFMLSDANPPLLLTQQSLLDKLPEYGGELLCLDSQWETVAVHSGDNLANRVTGDNLAYMIYTSGSTGKPKGVMNTHRGIVNRILWMQDEYRLNESDRVMQKTPFSFDVSVWELFWPLTVGACMVMAKPEGHKDAAYLAQLIQSRAITTMHFVPSMLQVFLEEKDITGCLSVKRVFCSGEALSFASQERFFERLPHAELHNLYGPTEAAIDVTYWECRRDSGLKVVPIGRPVANTQIYLLDEYLNPVPVGVAGELHIGGVQLARGYYNRPELTAEKFIRDPFSREAGARLYKTGDLARYLPDGSIEYLGRIDSMVKLRGFRIELGEIEAVLEEYPGVQQTAVLVHETEQKSKQLVAYVVADSQAMEEAKSAALPTEQVSDWQTVFDKAYDEDHSFEDDFNITSWNSSYTGEQLPSEQMRVWVDSTVERILALQPRRALEIGCGTGLLLSRVAPHCTQYWGTDFSRKALNYLDERLIGRRSDLSHVKLLQSYADDFSGIGGEQFDVIVLNSVVQYFPDSQYLVNVLENAVHAVGGRGAVFVGDVRSRTLLEAFLTEVEMEKATDSVSVEQLKRRVQIRMRQEQELVLEPAFFHALQEKLPQISHVEIQLKYGAHHNELTRYRYDVILHIGREVEEIDSLSWLDGNQQPFRAEDLRDRLVRGETPVLALRHVPNPRLDRANQYLTLLAESDGTAMVGELKRAAVQTAPEGLDPQQLWELGDSLGYQVDIRWQEGRTDGSYDAVIRRASGSDAILTAWPRLKRSWKPLGHYANHPMMDRIARQLTPELRSHAKEKLPDYMVPTLFEFLHEMPVTANGKLDRGALPAPLNEVRELEGDFEEPRTATEKALAEVWGEVLGLELVGIHHSFFGLGGDSIHSIRVVARAKERGLDFTPQHMFQYQTIAELASALEAEAQKSARHDGVEQAAAALSERDERVRQELLSGEGIQDVYPLTPFQEHMLNHLLTAPETGLYFVQNLTLAPFPGELDFQLVERVWQELVDRYDALRTTFAWENLDRPLQVVHRHVKAAVTCQDWRGLASVEEQEAKLEEYLQQDRTLGSAPTDPCGVRIFLAQMDGAFLTVISFSYMRLDGWSFNRIFEEMNSLFAAFAQGESPVAQAVRPFKDSVAIVNREDLEQAKTYWHERLHGFRRTQLASRIPVNRQGEEKGFARQYVRLSAETSLGLREMAKSHQLTLSTLIQGAWSLVQSCYAGSDEVVYGLVFNGRPVQLEGIEYMVGPFLNILPLHAGVSRTDALVSWLKRMMNQVMEMSRYQYTPLGKLQEWDVLPQERPFADNYLVFQNVTSEEIRSKTTNHFFVSKMGFPMRVDIYPEREINIHMSYYRHVFNDRTVYLLLRCFERALEAMVAAPGQRVEQLMEQIWKVPLITDGAPRVFYEGQFKIADIIG